MIFQSSSQNKIIRKNDFASETPNFSLIQTPANGSFYALFIRVTIFAVEPFPFVELLCEVPEMVLEQGTRGSSPEEVRRRWWSGGAAPGGPALLWLGTAGTAVARRGLAVRAGDDDREGTGGSSARRWRQPGKRHDAHGVAQGM